MARGCRTGRRSLAACRALGSADVELGGDGGAAQFHVICGNVRQRLIHVRNQHAGGCFSGVDAAE
jgi:hypothetical protein